MKNIESWSVFDFSTLKNDEIAKLLSEHNIPLSVEETKTVQNEFLKRPPTLAELVLFSIQGSEHSSYKSSKEHIKHFITDGPDVILGAKDDAGIVSVATDSENNRYGLVLSHESHNHPSQIVPYEGAATGVGGNVRDVCCMGAEVVAVGDGLRFGEIGNNKTKWIHDGVVSGIAGYGNPLGIPNICGDLYYDSAYNDNCLVTIVTAGVVKEKDIIRSRAPKNSEGYDLVLIGKPTDNSGFGGASFASLELEEEKKQQNKGAVQEPNAFLERHILKSTYSLFKYFQKNKMTDKVGFKDLGAGGVACASIELADAAGMGANVWVDKVHTSMPDLSSHDILCSETQERFMWGCHPAVTPVIMDHYNKKFDLPNVSMLAQAKVVGKIVKDPHYTVYANNKKIVDGPIKKINEGFVYKRPIKKISVAQNNDSLPKIKDYNTVLKNLLKNENIASRSPVYECYDKNVQGRTVLERGNSEAGVVSLLADFLVGDKELWVVVFKFLLCGLGCSDQFAVGGILQVKTGVEVALADLMFVGKGLLYGKAILRLFDMRQIGHATPVAGSAEDLKVVEGSTRLVDLEGEISAFLIDYGVFGVDQVVVVEMGDDLVADELDRHNVPFFGFEVVGAFAVAHGKPGTAVVHCGLDEEVVPPNMKDGVVVTGGTGDEAYVLGLVEAELEADDGVLEVGFLVEEALVFSRNSIAVKDAVANLPFLLEEPFSADLPLGEMIAEMQGFGCCQQGPRGNACPRSLPPSGELGLQLASPFGLIGRQVLFLGGILGEVEKLVFAWASGIEIFDQLPVPLAYGAAGNPT